MGEKNRAEPAWITTNEILYNKAKDRILHNTTKGGYLSNQVKTEFCLIYC